MILTPKNIKTEKDDKNKFSEIFEIFKMQIAKYLLLINSSIATFISFNKPVNNPIFNFYHINAKLPKKKFQRSKQLFMIHYYP